MNTHIVLLRGINVSGKNIIKMADLRSALQQEGFENPTTYIQTGNIVLQSSDTAQEVTSRVAQTISTHFTLSVPTVTIQRHDIENALEHNPFGEESAKAKQTYFGFMWPQPEASGLAAAKEINYPPEALAFYQNIVFLHSPNGAGKAKITHSLLERRLGVNVTIRNYNTLKKLLELSQNI
jgi:uncharacterized protein (DUF1697 family)